MSEMALVSASKVRLQHKAESGSAGASAAMSIAVDPNRFLSTVQIGITLVGILAGAYGGATLSGYVAAWLDDVPFIARYANGAAFVLVVTSITYLSLVIGELVPKRIALQNAETIAALVARPMMTVSRVAAPVVWLLGTSTNVILRLLRVRASDEPTVTEEEVAILLQHGTQAGVFEQSEHELVMNVFGIGERVAAEVMTPRFKVACVDINTGPGEALRVIRESGYQAYPVVDGDMDHVLGIASVIDLWPWLAGEEVSLDDAIHQPVFVPETLPLFRLLEELQRMRRDIALVVNEYGTVEGIVTLRDVVDEIIGTVESTAEQSLLNQPVVQRPDGTWLVDGLVPLHDVEAIIGIEALDEWSADRYQTLGGFVMGELGRIPQVSDVAAWNGWQFEVVDMDGNRVDRVLVTAPAAVEDA